MATVIVKTLSGTYLIVDGKWSQVSPDAKLSDYLQPPKPVERKVVKIESSTPGTFYEVTINNDTYTCNCVGFTYRRKCKHTEQAKVTA